MSQQFCSCEFYLSSGSDPGLSLGAYFSSTHPTQMHRAENRHLCRHSLYLSPSHLTSFQTRLTVPSEDLCCPSPYPQAAVLSQPPLTTIYSSTSQGSPACVSSSISLPPIHLLRAIKHTAVIRPHLCPKTFHLPLLRSKESPCSLTCHSQSGPDISS